MIEVIIVAKTVITRIVRRIDIDELHFAREAIAEGVECDEIVSFDEEIGAKLSLTIEELDIIRTRDLMIPTRVDTTKIGQYFSLLERINIRAINDLMEESLLPPSILTAHSTLEDRILERE